MKYTYARTNRVSFAHHKASALLLYKPVCLFTVNALWCPSARPRLPSCAKNPRGHRRLFLVLEQLVNLGLVHVLDVLQVEPQLLGFFRFLSVHLQDGVVSLLQVLRREKCTSTEESCCQGAPLRWGHLGKAPCASWRGHLKWNWLELDIGFLLKNN